VKGIFLYFENGKCMTEIEDSNKKLAFLYARLKKNKNVWSLGACFYETSDEKHLCEI
jgi:hypothetical protein